MVLTSDTTDEPWYYNSTFMWESLNVSATLTATLLVYEAPHTPWQQRECHICRGSLTFSPESHKIWLELKQSVQPPASPAVPPAHGRLSSVKWSLNEKDGGIERRSWRRRGWSEGWGRWRKVGGKTRQRYRPVTLDLYHPHVSVTEKGTGVALPSHPSGRNTIALTTSINPHSSLNDGITRSRFLLYIKLCP